MERPTLFMVCTALVIAAGGIPKGYDEGGFSAAVGLTSFKEDYGLMASEWTHDANGLANRTANITSFGVLGAAFGSVFAIMITDRLGRLRSWQFLSILWATGTLVQVFSSGIYGLLLFSRIWSGLGAGGLCVVTPLYLSEIATSKHRGLTVGVFMVFLLSSLSLGFFINYAANLHMKATREQYRLVEAIPLIPVGFAFICSFFLSETPRYYALNDSTQESLHVISKLRGLPESDPTVLQDLDMIQTQVRENAQQLKGATPWALIRETFSNSSYRQRYISAMTMQIVSQWTGGNGITYYIPEIFSYAGVTGSSNQLVSSGVYGLVKLVFTMIFAWGLIDIFGRRRCMLVGLVCQFCAHVYLAVYMAKQPGDATNKSASDGAEALIYIYAMGWSIGLCTIPFLYSAEIFPTRIRAVCYSSLVSANWFMQFAVVRVTPNMLVGLKVWGAFAFWGTICAIGIVVLGIVVPETKGIAMEEMEQLFAGRWFMAWRARKDFDRDGPFAGNASNEKVEEEWVQTKRY